jgi:hypothetical protein
MTNNFFFFAACRNCRVQCEGSLCNICLERPECRRCRRRLSNDLFTSDPEICDACLRKIQKGASRSALDGTVTEHDLETSDNDIDLQAFLMNNNGELLSILQRALDANM